MWVGGLDLDLDLDLDLGVRDTCMYVYTIPLFLMTSYNVYIVSYISKRGWMIKPSFF